ncbi:hypothetical protein [Amycolatopsis solani]|uniref:hypothetical protein n=1 Tax=Amycolatopsis solani TaxID=3028615 RepID=UPI0025AFD583|nr:hypothetical protein [Amycolatopsis sp. MEP2-6]
MQEEHGIRADNTENKILDHNVLNNENKTPGGDIRDNYLHEDVPPGKRESGPGTNCVTM